MSCAHGAYQFLPSPLLRSVQGLEQAIETLDAQFQACELVKIDVGGLSNKNLPEPDQKVSLGGTIFPSILGEPMGS